MAESKMISPPSPMVMIGGSAGSLEVVMRIIATTDPALNISFVIVLHRKSSVDSSLVYVLTDKTTWPVKEIDEKDEILPRHIYVAPGDYHLLIEKDLHFSLDVSEKINYSRPSIDICFESAADIYGSRLTAILLSGANSDGTEGMQKVKQKGGRCIVQDPATAEVPFMPQQAIENVDVDYVADGDKIGELLNFLFSS